jgi:hypothetical protein
MAVQEFALPEINDQRQLIEVFNAFEGTISAHEAALSAATRFYDSLREYVFGENADHQHLNALIEDIQAGKSLVGLDEPPNTDSCKAVLKVQGCSTLYPSVGPYSVEVEDIAIESIADIGFVVEAKDVQCEGAQQGEDVWVAANAAAVFTQGFVAYPVQTVLDMPVSADDVAPIGAVMEHVAEVQGDFHAGLPFRSFGLKAFDATLDLDQSAKPPVPGLGAEFSGEWPDIDDTLLDSVAPPEGVARFGAAGGLESDLAGERLQRRLVTLHLHQQVVARIEHGFNRFFGHAERPR